MITRANIRRQLRASGGITNAISRKDYSMGGSIGGGIIQGNPMGTRTGYFNPFKVVKKAVKKVANVAKQVVKSPLGKAAILGLGASMLGPSIGGGGIGNFFKGMGGKLFGTAAGSAAGPFSYLQGAQKFTPGILGKLGLTKGGGSMGITGLGKLAGGGLLSYFMSKGATEEEAKGLSADVNRGSGMGFDQIQRDIAAYRGGGQDESQMAAKGYRFLTPKRFTQPLATGGRVGLQAGTPEEGIKSLEAGASSIKVKGDVRPPEMKMAEIPRDMTMDEAVRNFDLSEPELSKKLKGTKEYVPAVIEFFKNRKLSAMGGRIGYDEGGLGNELEKNIFLQGGTTLERLLMTKEEVKKDKAKIKKELKDIKEKQKKELDKKLYKMGIRKKIKKAMGGIMDMPTGNMRRNKAGIKEIDYRATGGFVPVGIKEKADDVPAMLSKNEFVMTADAVRGAGNGSIKKGAQRMYDLMKQNESKVV